MNDQSTLGHLQEAVGALRFRDKARAVLASVRRLDEVDEGTLHRVVEEYTAIRTWLLAHATLDESVPIREGRPSACFKQIVKMFGEPAVVTTARLANASNTNGGDAP